MKASKKINRDEDAFTGFIADSDGADTLQGH
jgi:hypothetical protein